MFKRSLQALVRRYGIWLILQVALGAGLFALTVVLALELARPIRVSGAPARTAGDPQRIIPRWGPLATGELVSADQLLEGLPTRETVSNRIAAAMRAGLFKSATPLGDKPMADKTIEKILSQLRLQCIIPISGELVAYVNVDKSGLKKCRVGDSVEDLFTVIGIGQRSIEITIVDHPVTLSL